MDGKSNSWIHESDDTWSLGATLAPPPGSAGNFGASISVHLNTLAVGAPNDDTAAPDAGVVYVYRRTSRTPAFCDASDGSLAACPCGNPGLPDTGCDLRQATGGVGLSVAAQSTSPSNRATLVGSGFPLLSLPGVTAIRGTQLDAASPVVFGDGLRCVGIPVVRVGATTAAGGIATLAVVHGAMAGAGTFYYQLWLRNTPAGYCDPTAAFNLSNGRAISW